MNNCLIIPCYNEEKRFPFQEFINFYESTHFHFCLINDGSKDKTGELLNQLQISREGRVKVIQLSENIGKAEAVRIGVLEALQWKPFEYISFLDADLSAPFDQIELLLSQFHRNKDFEFIFGSRVKLLGWSIERKALRHYIGRIFATSASVLLKVAVYDTQCGAKVFKAELASQIFKDKFISSWLFDVEIFARVIKLKGKSKALLSMYETPLEKWTHKKGSKLSWTVLFRVPVELFKIYLKYRRYL